MAGHRDPSRMKKNNLLLPILIVLMALPSALQAQDTRTVDECIDYCMAASSGGQTGVLGDPMSYDQNCTAACNADVNTTTTVGPDPDVGGDVDINPTPEMPAALAGLFMLAGISLYLWIRRRQPS